MQIREAPVGIGGIERERPSDMVDNPTLFARVDAALDRVRPGIVADGGDVWLMRIADGVAYVQMVGACGGCAAALSTLKLGIERAVCADVPEIHAVEQL
jgi:iron-sulfur cluster assembly protein